MMVSHCHKPENYMGLRGTKFGHAPYTWTAPTLGEMYDHIIESLGECYLNKPVPGHVYVKLKKALRGMDTPTFRRMPEEIIITQPARLFRSRSWRYKGRIYGEADTFWKFQCKSKRRNEFKPGIVYSDGSRSPVWQFNRYTGCTEFMNEWQFMWFPIFLLSNCYTRID